MHELSIVLNIVDIAEEEVKKVHAQKVDAIELEIGTQAGIEWEALEFSWSTAVKYTVLSNAERIVDKVQAIAKCTNCDGEFMVYEPFQPCPFCKSPFVTYLKGKELRIKSLVVS